ncbi:MAG: Sensor protein DegS [Candidatus Rifleibacterium amylolyticum]|nr:MAG: Sensor protein DegS [Candidatus Rifleibacterium amylolyticum]
MPESSLDALTHELEVFRNSLQQLQKIVAEQNSKQSRQSNLTASLADLENVIISASATMPPHVSEMARSAFKKLQAALGIYAQPEDDELLQVSTRLNMQGNSILRRVSALLLLINSPANANGIILAQEEERKRISREIHDGPAQTLASLTMRIDYCLEQPGLPQPLVDELKELKESVIRSLKDIRRFIFDLRPMALDDLGLLPTLEQFIGGFKNRTGVPVYIDTDGERAFLGGDKELAVFRVIQEATNNALRHSNPNSVHIFLKFDAHKQRLSVVIKDDGSGFDVAETRRVYGNLKKLGLISMEERIRLSGGEFSIVSDSGSGTVVSFWVPLG